LDEAIAQYREAIRLKADYADAHNGLGKVLHKKRDLDGAIDAYNEAIRLKPDYAKAHSNMGLALEEQGQFRAALAELRRGHELGSRQPDWHYPSAQWVRDAERRAAFDAVLPTVLRGQASPADASAAAGFADLCQLRCKRLYAGSARFYADGFAVQPNLAGDMQSGHRYNAACAAALAAAGQGDDAPAADADRAHLRAQALGWLRADLGAWRALLEKKPDANRPAVAQQLRHWREDSDLAGVRDGPALAGLPEAERAEWKALWADVEKTLAKAPDAAPGGKGKDKP
jgi:tetratricopeptide (TPR) repeat protein